MKNAIAIATAFGIGFLCAKTGLPLPAPPTLIGVGLVLAITVGYIIGK